MQMNVLTNIKIKEEFARVNNQQSIVLNLLFILV